MSLLSQIAAYGSVITMMSTFMQTPEAPTLPPPTVLSIQTSDDYQIENFQLNTQSVGSHRVGDIQDGVNHPIVNGIDIASHQHNASANMNIPKVIQSGEIQFSFIKATEGTHYVNPNFREDTIEFINNKVPIGFYHYARPSKSVDDAKEQAQYFVNVTGINQGVKTFPPVLDIEEDSGLNSTDLIKWTEGFVNEVKRLTGRDVMIYTYPSFWKNNMANTTKFNNLPLWIADYNKKSSPTIPLPGGWKDWTFWQYTDNEKITGIGNGVDGNIYNGDYNSLRSLYSQV